MKKILYVFLAMIILMVGISVLHGQLYEPGYATADDVVTRIVKIDKDNVVTSDEVVDDDDDNEYKGDEEEEDNDDEDKKQKEEIKDQMDDVDEDYYYFYGTLSTREKTVYVQMLNAIEEGDTGNVIPSKSVSINQIVEIKDAVFHDHPELFWFNGGLTYSYSSSVANKDDDGVYVNFYSIGYNKLRNNLDENQDEFDSACDEILKGIEDKSSVKDKERYLVETLVEDVTYESDGYVVDQTAYGAIVDHEAVCAGYSRAAQYLCQKADIPAYYCTGTANGGTSSGRHGWNIVKIGDNYFNLDVTWCDQSENGYLDENYYNVLDSQISDNHFRDDLSKKLPACE